MLNHAPYRKQMAAGDWPLLGAASAIDSGVLDAAALARLIELDPQGENQLLERVFKAFESSTARLMPKLQESRVKADGAGIRHVAHTLKSASASLGAMKLSQLCAEVEHELRQPQPEGLEARVDAMAAEVELVLQVLKQLLEAKP
jgi:HPt (histidine-containing phosphotransfer) domain-containing protein